MSRATEQAGRGHAIEARRFQASLILLRTWFAFTLLGFAVGAMLACMASSKADQHLAMAYAHAQAVEHLTPQALLGRKPVTPPATMTDNDTPERAAAMRLLWRGGIAGTILALLLGGGLAALLRQHWIKTAEAAALDQVRRGNNIATPQQLIALLAFVKKMGSPILMGGVPVPPQDEARHMMLVGGSGSGKTTALRTILRQIAQRGQHALIFDADGSYVAHFYDPARHDVILNPWDARSHRWDMLADVANLDDAHRIAAILLPKPTKAGDSGFWFDQARTLLAHILDHQARSDTTSLADLSATLNSTTADDLRAIAANTPAARIFEAGGERATASVLFMMTMAARTIATLATIPQSAPAFSFDRFYSTLGERDGPQPFVFMAAPRRYREAGAPVIAAFIDAAASAILQRPPENAAPAWLMIDELASLPPVQSLLTLMPEGRKHEARVIIACQSIAQLRQAFGPEGTEIISGQTATQLIMSVGDTATAKWATDLIGTVEVENQRTSEQLGGDEKARGSIAVHRERKGLVLDSEVTGLPVGQGYLRLSGYPIAKVRITPPKGLAIIAPSFVPASSPPRTTTTTSTVPSATRIEDRDDWLSMGDL